MIVNRWMPAALCGFGLVLLFALPGRWALAALLPFAGAAQLLWVLLIEERPRPRELFYVRPYDPRFGSMDLGAERAWHAAQGPPVVPWVPGVPVEGRAELERLAATGDMPAVTW